MYERQKRYKERHRARVAAADRRYRQTPEGRAKNRKCTREWEARNPEWHREHRRILSKVTYHVRVGHLVRTPCVVCGVEPVQGHHHNGYGPEHELDVIWLCIRHHVEAHGRRVRG